MNVLVYTCMRLLQRYMSEDIDYFIVMKSERTNNPESVQVSVFVRPQHCCSIFFL